MSMVQPRWMTPISTRGRSSVDPPAHSSSSPPAGLGAVFADLITGLIIIATAASLCIRAVDSAAQAAEAPPLAGRYAIPGVPSFRYWSGCARPAGGRHGRSRSPMLIGATPLGLGAESVSPSSRSSLDA